MRSGRDGNHETSDKDNDYDSDYDNDYDYDYGKDKKGDRTYWKRSKPWDRKDHRG